MEEPSIYHPPAPTRHLTRESPISRGRTRLLMVTTRREEAVQVARLLSQAGAERVRCQTVASTREALRDLRRGGFDAVLVDADALHDTGLFELERLCDAAAAVPVLLIASVPGSLAIDAIRRGVQDVLRRDQLSPDRLAQSVASGIERQRRLAELRDLSLKDPLTSLYNRRGFRTLTEAGLRIMRRTHRQSLLLYADVDHLKHINDHFGHAAGDQALRLCAAALARSLRGSDVVARYGGDEFVALALDVNEGAGLVLLPRIASILAGLARAAKVTYPLTLSVGTATFGPGISSLEEVLDRADRALYGEKRRRHSPLAAGS
jgi:two-component system cell cycle response regulator